MKTRRMARRTALAASVLLLGLTGVTAAQAAKEDEPIGWGKPRDGLQVGLVPLNPQRSYRYDEALAFQIRVRNVTEQPVEYTLSTSDSTYVGLGPGNLLTVETGSGAHVPLRLGPGEEKAVPNSTYLLRLRGSGGVEGFTQEDERQQKQLARLVPDTTTFRSPIVRLQPGDYTLRCPFPLWIADAKDPSRATAHRAKPGVLKFRLAGKSAARAPRPSEIEGVTVHWGQDVNGLQAGIAAGPNGTPGELPLIFYVRNLMDYPIEVSYPDLIDADWHPRVVGADGKEHIVRTTFLSRWITQKQVTLQPGQALPIGKTTVRTFTQEPAAGGQSVLPTLIAPAGKYRISLSDGVRYAGSSGFDIVLVTGDLEFTVRAQ